MNTGYISQSVRMDLENFAEEQLNRMMEATRSKLLELLGNNKDVLAAYDAQIADLEATIEDELRDYANMEEAAEKLRKAAILENKRYKQIVNVEMPKYEGRAKRYDEAIASMGEYDIDSPEYHKYQKQAERFEDDYFKIIRLQEEADEHWRLAEEATAEVNRLEDEMEALIKDGMTPRQRTANIYERRLDALKKMRENFAHTIVHGSRQDLEEICDALVSSSAVSTMTGATVNAFKGRTNGEFTLMEPGRQEELLDKVKSQMEKYDYENVNIIAKMVELAKEEEKVGGDKLEIFDLSKIDKDAFVNMCISYLKISMESNIGVALYRLALKWKNTVQLIQEGEDGESYDISERRQKHNVGQNSDGSDERQFRKNRKDFGQPEHMTDLKSYYMGHLHKMAYTLYMSIMEDVDFPATSIYHKMSEERCVERLENELSKVVNKISSRVNTFQDISDTMFNNIVSFAIGGSKDLAFKHRVSEIIRNVLLYYFLEFTKEEYMFDENDFIEDFDTSKSKFWSKVVNMQNNLRNKLVIARRRSVKTASVESCSISEIFGEFNRLVQAGILKKRKKTVADEIMREATRLEKAGILKRRSSRFNFRQDRGDK